LAQAWADEDRGRLFLYLHVPYCEQRCGFCNLFTQVTDSAPDDYLAAMERQAAAVAGAIGPARFARCAVGGGTPFAAGGLPASTPLSSVLRLSTRASVGVAR
jgi:oxygen-independent coproporphyrinogen-3 oxidase